MASPALAARLAEAGIALKHTRAGEQRGACSRCGRGRSDDALAIRLDHVGVTWFCHRCGWRGALAEERSAGQRAVLQPAPAKSARTAPAVVERFLDLWHAAEPINPDSAAGSYLRARGCRLPPAGGDLRWLPEHRHPSGHRGPALLALLTDAVSGEPRSLHRTWVNPDGTKAEIDKPRLLWPGAIKRGAVCRLWADREVTTGLAVAEGVETALAAAWAFEPMWAAIDAGNLAALPVLKGIEALTVFADHDRSGCGQRAAAACASRWRAAGVEVRVALPDGAGRDYADTVKGT